MAETQSSWQSRLQQARPFLSGSFECVDPLLPTWLSILRNRGASECFHKHSTFYEHLVSVYRILKLWNVPDVVARFGLFHSCYSNSFVNLAIFEPDVGRQTVGDIIGDLAEELVHLFCIVPRWKLIYEMMLFQFKDDELLAALHGDNLDVDSRSQHDVDAHFLERLKSGIIDEEERSLFAIRCKRKVAKIIPPEGLVVKHIRTGEDVRVPRRVLAIFLLVNIADVIEQRYSYQDALYEDENGILTWAGNNWATIWPGESKPGLWMNAISSLGLLYNLIAREEKEMEVKGDRDADKSFSQIELVIPPIFNNCTEIISPADQLLARDLYWEVICKNVKPSDLQSSEPVVAESQLKKACKLNPWVAEPHVILAQIYLGLEKFELAEREAQEGLRLLIEWGTPWHKSTSWEGWISWCRVLLQKAQERSWKKDKWAIINLGLVK
eukprot:c28296_g1_i2 orf=227-1543(-)